jgi:hypothetical protein
LAGGLDEVVQQFRAGELARLRVRNGEFGCHDGRVYVLDRDEDGMGIRRCIFYCIFS